MKVICVSGSVGSGKTFLSKKLSKELKFTYMGVTKEIKKNKLYEKYDRSSKSYVVDDKKLIKYLLEKIKKTKKGLIIDSIFSHLLPKKNVDLCIVTTCDISILKKRLKKRKYSLKKIIENLQVEIFDSFIIEAKNKKHNLLILNTSKSYNIKDIVKFVKKC